MSFIISATSPTSDYRDSLLEKAITSTAMKLAKERSISSIPKDQQLDVSFLVSGKLEKPAFSGMRMGNFDDAENTLYFERAVPEEMLHSEKAEEFVMAVLEDVIMNASDYFQEYKINFDIFSWKKGLSNLN